MVIDLSSCTNCRACQVACSNANQTPYWADKGRTHVEDSLRGTERLFLPRLCQQCEDAPCERVCPTGATYRTADGIVEIEPSNCIGCKACMAACPYGARYVYDHHDIKHAEGLYGELTRVKVPHIDKCDLCADRRAQGLVPACVLTCMGKARIFGDLDDPASEVSKATGNAVRLGPEFGTNPRILYIPKEGRK